MFQLFKPVLTVASHRVLQQSENKALPEDHANIARMMTDMFDSMILWQSGWNRPLKHIDLM